METYTNLKQQLIQHYQAVRRKTEELCLPLNVEDYVIQSISDVSPPRWHLAHTTWFFETFILLSYLKDYQLFDPQFHYLFNSYYHGIGKPYPRDQRGLLSRPTVATIYTYREWVDKHILSFIDNASEQQLSTAQSVITLGLHHEQQHQELLLMDIKHNFSLDPNFPIYYATNSITNYSKLDSTNEAEFIYEAGGLVEIGNKDSPFCFDNELPRHSNFIKPYLIATKLVTNNDYCEFIAAGGYKDPRWWLADGWDYVQKNQWQSPLYWHRLDNKLYLFTLSGLKELDPAEPVSHVSYFEADAYARWREKRLPLEVEWEHFVTNKNITPTEGNFMETKIYHPLATTNNDKTIPQQFFGDLWEWTANPYSPYPGFKSLVGALGEYNGKFMNNQFVLRGGCCVTPQSHIRTSYRNFFQPDKRWQFSGIRLASDV